MTREELATQIRKKGSFLCVGLDTDIQKIPPHLLQYEDPVFEFNKAIIDATHDLCVAYKPNIAFYESQGSQGWRSLERTLAYMPDNIFSIADAKRGDIGNTSSLYARAFFSTLSFDAVTVNPYMGEDSVSPFLDFEGKWAVVLGLTSNEGSRDFQYLRDDSGRELYKEVIGKCSTWGSAENMMFVVGATHPEELLEIRRLCPGHFFLVPGVGAQGGDLEAVVRNGMNEDVGLLVNSTRGIIYRSSGEDFAQKARQAARELRDQMRSYL